MHLTALVESPEHVCCRYRLTAFRPWLERAGHRLQFLSLPRRPWAWFGLTRTLRDADAVILQRKLLNGWQRFLLRRHARRLLFDFDDAVFLRDSYAAKGLHCRRRLQAFAGLLRVVDAVVAGNPFLREQALPWAGPERAYVIPTCVDPALYPLAEPRRAGAGVQLVWIGSSSTLRGLEAIRPLLESLGQEVPGLQLKLVCDRFLELRDLSVLPCAWSEAGEAEALASADIGIGWVPDDLWSRGKCGLKVLQYMAAGLPVVANPVGVQAAMVRHGETGFLAETPEQWRQAIRLLARDPDLRRRMGQAGRHVLERDYSVAAGAAQWLTLLQRLQSRQDGRMTG